MKDPSVHFGRSVEVAPQCGHSGAIRRQFKYKDALIRTAYEGDAATLYETWQLGLKHSRDRPCLGYRPVLSTEVKDGKEVTKVGDYQWFTYGEVQVKIDAFGSGMVHLGLAKDDGLGNKLVGLYSKNRWEWVVASEACNTYSVANVPFYDTLGAEAVAFICAQSGLSTVFTGRAETGKLVKMKATNATELKELKNVIQFDDVTDEERAAAQKAGITLRSFVEVSDIGRANPKPHQPPKPKDLAFICYTSGTTGMPKGAMITHENLVADSSSQIVAEIGICDKDVYLSYLPLAHVMERLIQAALFAFGAAVGFYQGETLKVMEDIKALRPTLFASVPRLFNRIYDKVTSGVAEAGGIKGLLFNTALESKRLWLQYGGYVNSYVFDPLVFDPIKKRIGFDRVRLMVTSSAPLSPHVLEFLRCVFGCPIIEGYGQTECSGAATATDIHNQASLGHIGTPLACNEIKLVSVPEMGYSVTDTVHGREVDDQGAVLTTGESCQGRGEICFRGYNVIPGYYRDPEKTAEAIDAEGWLHSGDIGLWDAAGNLRIIDRKKNIFKLAQGEYVAAEKIENIYLRSTLVAQVFVYGDSLHSVLLAVVVPDEDGARAWCRAQGRDPATSLAVLCADADFTKAVLDDIVKVSKENKLQGFEIAKAVVLDPVAWTSDSLLTPSLKLKRVDAKRVYQKKVRLLRKRVVLVVAFALFCFGVLYAVTFTPQPAPSAKAPATAAVTIAAAAASKKSAGPSTPVKEAPASSSSESSAGRRSTRKRSQVERFEPSM